MRVVSILDISLVDVPGIPVSVIFTAGCNFDCPFCQNADALPLDSGEEMTIDHIVKQLKDSLADGVCVTGGEPTIQKELPLLLSEMQKIDLGHINLNTQGSVPSILKNSLPFLDSIWLDIKASAENYQRVCRTKENPWNRVKQSIDLIMASNVEFWPRTTYAGNLMDIGDLRWILRYLEDIGFEGRYTIQNYVASTGVREEEKPNLRVPEIEEVDIIKDEVPTGIELDLQWR